ncbi:MAG: rubrerythrin family protein [Vicinamibacteria bacterium]|jgi:rubrerythrin|nr:rubrerythrin family protein [Vicinamibacteria bacterium]
MKKITAENLQAAFAGESQAHMKYLNFAERAAREGQKNAARVFEAAAYAERIHASNHLKALNGVQDTSANLGAALSGESFEIDEMYPAYKAVAELQGEKAALRSMNWALEAEKVHAALYAAAKKEVDAGRDAEVGALWVCAVCGFTGEGESPDVCPLCGVKREFIKTF